MHKFFNPGKVFSFIEKTRSSIFILAITFLSLGVYFAFFDSPPDYQQGETVRIMYIHVPAAWLSLIVYTIVASSSAAYIIWNIPISNSIAKACAPIGAIFTLITLVTGSLWGKPTWGAWWVWDARLTSMLMLFFLYIGYISLTNAMSDKPNSKAPAVLAIVGLINIPIIKFSVDVWNTLHQPASIIKAGGPSIHSSMLKPLVFMMLGYSFYFLFILAIRLKTDILSHRIQRLENQLIRGK
jgi:heme exporter protein C